MKWLGAFLLMLSPLTSWSQQLVGFSTKWDDSFSEWLIYTDDEDVVGELSMRWAIRNDWSEWDYRIGETTGSIRVKWKDDPNLWELRSDNEIISIRSVFKDDWRHWEISSSHQKIDVKSRYGNVFEEWKVDDRQLGVMDIFTSWEGDLRDWVVEDQLDVAVSLGMKIATSFIPILYAVPKY